MSAVAMPALDGTLALGWLAALGTLRLVTRTSPDAALSWDRAEGVAVLHSRLPDVDAVVQILADERAALAEGQFWPDAPSGFPPPGEAPDRIVVPRTSFAGLYESVDDARDLLGALVTDLAVNDGGTARRTPYVAPTGKQSFFTMVRNQHEAVADPARLREALSGWVRWPGSGESFDAAAVRSGADAVDGKPGERAVPGATWLAVQALPALRLAGDGRATIAGGWWRVARVPHLVWPLWEPALSVAAATTLLEHPLLRPRPGPGHLRVDLDRLRGLGVWRVCGAKRRKTGNSDGPLVPVAVRGART